MEPNTSKPPADDADSTDQTGRTNPVIHSGSSASSSPVSTTPASTDTSTTVDTEESQPTTMQHSVTISPMSTPRDIPEPTEATVTAPQPEPVVPIASDAPTPQVFGQVPPPLAMSSPINAVPQVTTFEELPTGMKASTFGANGGDYGNSRRKLFIFGGSILAVMLLAAVAVFGLYLPNTPSHVYSTGIERSGDALSSLITSATSEDKLKTYATSNIQGSVHAIVSGTELNGDFTTKFDKTSSDSGLNVSYKEVGGQDQKVTLKALSQIPKDGLYPDVYLQLSGIKALGLDAFLPGISDYDSKWVLVSSDYLKSLGSDFGVASGDNTKSSVTSSDVSELARTSMNVTKEYVFTTDENKAVLQQTSFVGKETVDGIKTYHYKMKINASNAKDYCVALTNAVVATDAVKKLTDEGTITKVKNESARTCNNEVKSITKNDGGAFDMWVDAKYKLIHKIRFSDPSNKQAYTEFGQNYSGGDKLSLFANYVDGKSKTNGKLTLDVDLKAGVTAATLNLKNSNKDSFDVTANLGAKGSDTVVNIVKPATSVSIQDVLKRFGIDSTATGINTSGPSAPVQTRAKDTERQVDIMAVDSHLEQYFAQYDKYPSLAELNDPTWRTTNMQGLDTAALQDPDGSAATLAATTSKTQYGYAPSGCTSSGCQTFSISATLSDGTKFTKSSS